MNLKKVNWVLIWVSTTIITIIITVVYQILFDNISLKEIIFVAAIFPIIGLSLSVESKTKGCLSGKTPLQKENFFNSLHSFKDKDLLFYCEQLRDLKENEFKEYVQWLVKQIK